MSETLLVIVWVALLPRPGVHPVTVATVPYTDAAACRTDARKIAAAARPAHTVRAFCAPVKPTPRTTK